MRSGRITAAVVWITLHLGLGLVGCSDNCENVNCGSGVTVVWSEDEVPMDASVRLCVNGTCDSPTQASPRGVVGANEFGVGLRRATADMDVSVKLEILGADGSVTRSVEGSGTKTGDCCPGVTFTPSADGRRLVVHPD